MSASVDAGIFPDIGELADKGLRWAKMAIWADNPLTQIAVNAVIIVAMMLSSSVGFVAGIPIAFVGLFFAGIGALRLLLGAVM